MNTEISRTSKVELYDRKDVYNRVMSILEESKVNVSSIKDKFYIYALYQDDELVYIGQSTNPVMRINQHFKLKKFNYFSLLEVVDKYTMDALEQYLIYKNKPKYNKTDESKYIEVRKLRGMIINDYPGLREAEEIYTNNLAGILKEKGIDVEYNGRIAVIHVLDMPLSIAIVLSRCLYRREF